MKINEKNLINFAASSTPIDQAGWLEKRGEMSKGFQKRWFVLKGNLLYYFEKQGDREPLGVIILEGCTIELAEDDEPYVFKIVFHGAGNRSYVLKTDSQETMEQWMEKLARGSYDYMKVMVNELQRQLDEIEELPTVLDSASIQRVGVVKEGKSPNPPPRQRQNPFNQTSSTNEGSNYQHQRSHSLRMASDGTIAGRGDLPRPRATFRDIHNAYGRRILEDFNEWKRSKQPAEENLINF